ncbi:MAG TPA: c-type cytochrome [Usitatibacter sp.]|nr:c-type cytochrome [Usitatibacter sp.]
MGGNGLRKAAKLAGIVLAVLALAALGLVGGGAWLGERKMARTVSVRVVPVSVTASSASLQRGRYLFEARGCAECHAADGHGLAMIDDPNGLFVKSPNITGGRGGVTRAYEVSDWVRAIRHGVSPSGRPLLVMPSEDYSRMSDADLSALIAYARSLPPVEGTGTEIRMPLLVKALYGLGRVRDAAEKIDHRRPPEAAIAPAPDAAYGAYVAQMCRGCHRPDLSGGAIAGAPPSWPSASRLAPGPQSAMARYDTLAKFAAMMKSGKRPDGSAVSAVMPFATLAELDDTDVAALYAYLTSLPAH